MIEITPASAEHIATCDVPGPRNNFGKKKLFVRVTQDGLFCWCKTCQQAHFLPRAEVMAAWERGESVQCTEDGQRV